MCLISFLCLLTYTDTFYVCAIPFRVVKCAVALKGAARECTTKLGTPEITVTEYDTDVVFIKILSAEIIPVKGYVANDIINKPCHDTFPFMCYLLREVVLQVQSNACTSTP